MNLAGVKDLITSKTARQVLVTQKHSPKILFVAGVVGVVGTVVMACRATLKLSDVLEQHEKNVSDIQNTESMTVRESVDGLETRNKQLAKLKFHAALDVAKLYAPAVGLGVASIFALTGSHIVLSRRNAGLMALYAGLDKAHKEYRQRVATEFGEDTDRKFAAGAETVEVQEKTADGKTKITTKDVVAKGHTNSSPYRALFGEHSCHWTREPGMNPIVLGMIQSHMNDQLRARGHLFLNEVFDRLDLPRTEAGALTGWVYRKDNEEKTGDNYVSFGIFDGPLDDANAFLDGEEQSIWLDFNVDGVIYKLIEKEKTAA